MADMKSSHGSIRPVVRFADGEVCCGALRAPLEAIPESVHESSEASTELASDPEDTTAHLDTPMRWPSLPNEGLWEQGTEALPVDEALLPTTWLEAAAHPVQDEEWWSVSMFGGTAFGDAFSDGTVFGDGSTTFGIDASTFETAHAFDNNVSLPELPDNSGNSGTHWEWVSFSNCLSDIVAASHESGHGATEAMPSSVSLPESDCEGGGNESTSGSTNQTSEKTTVLLRSLPTDFTRADLVELLEDEGFDGTFDFVYLPIDFGSEACLGYAFVNFRCPGDARRCWEIFSGLTDWGRPSEKACQVMWAEPCQGLEAHVERYRSSPVMHSSVPDEWKPAMFHDGVRVPFPLPTKSVSAPKVRRRNVAKEQRA
eukprot:CAMPEP_0172705066 /NCGR_PEP_ID=MMETSP1074-20121228/42241_1 /TAXON_ID=2916 /ORGANISM="Ceratium fusus, Strain PA161109" /LENGTH=369 /DNA_ID=CAMNT_0013527339 /DNA_START=102 /DNA_END=1211 /DNA_ORIENTATION=-